MQLPSLRLILLACLLPFAASCASSDKEPEPVWTSAVVESANDRILWQVGLRACDKLDFPLRAGLDPSTMVIETGWRTNLQPFKGDGTREKAELRFVPEDKGVWRIEARVKRQVNMALAAPLDERYAEWKWTPDDFQTARVLVQHVRSYLMPDIDPVDRPDDPIEALLRDQGVDGR